MIPVVQFAAIILLCIVAAVERSGKLQTAVGAVPAPERRCVIPPRMARQSPVNLVDVSDSLTVAVLGLALFAGKIAGVLSSPANVAIAAGTLLAAALLLLADFHRLGGRWAWSGWLVLVIAAAAFAVVNL